MLSDRRGGQVQVTCVIASEINAPEGEAPIEWRLLTNREVKDFEAAAELVDGYRPPKQAPKLNTVIRLIAGLGGFLGHRYDGEPGMQTLWLGLQRVRDFAEGMQFA